ncbi:helix-turn-helix transcriptional regulator [bacterium]|nr:helix-turn-helix transcriptional regulator [bacterium]
MNKFGELLKYWRHQRGLSQLAFSLQSDVSQRHISFLESGRSKPSQGMIATLCQQLEIPLKQSNDLFLSAGFAAPFSHYTLDDQQNKELKNAVELILGNHMPYPAIAIDPMHNILMANDAAIQLQLFLYDVVKPSDLPECASNVLLGLFHQNGHGKFIENFEEVASLMYQRFLAEISHYHNEQEAKQLHQSIKSCARFSKSFQCHTSENSFPTLTVDFKKGDQSMSFFSMISSFGAPFDITIQNLRIELFFPKSQR